jgi:hypothetical protein
MLTIFLHYRASIDEEDPAIPLAPNNIKVVSSHERPHWFTQFRILADRTFKNLYRNPMLMFAHYTIAVVLACKFIPLMVNINGILYLSSYFKCYVVVCSTRWKTLLLASRTEWVYSSSLKLYLDSCA